MFVDKEQLLLLLLLLLAAAAAAAAAAVNASCRWNCEDLEKTPENPMYTQEPMDPDPNLHAITNNIKAFALGGNAFDTDVYEHTSTTISKQNVQLLRPKTNERQLTQTSLPKSVYQTTNGPNDRTGTCKMRNCRL